MNKHPLIIPEDCHGLRIDMALAQLFQDHSRSRLTALVKSGDVTLNGKTCKPKDKVKSGDFIALTKPIDRLFLNTTSTLEAQEIHLDIVYEDEDILIVNKSAGLVVHPGAGNPNHTLANALLHHASILEGLPRAGIVHRLDKDTTGLMVVAKTLVAHTALIRMMQEREIKRQYLTLVHGDIVSGGTINTNFGRHPKNRLKMSVCPNGKSAITHFGIEKRFQGLTYLRVTLETGRTHQIRVHMAYIQHPVIGDALYGHTLKNLSYLTETERAIFKQFNRQALHATLLTFNHPVSNIPLTFTAQIPDDFNTLMTILDKHHGAHQS